MRSFRAASARRAWAIFCLGLALPFTGASAPPLAAQTPTLRMDVDTTLITIGDPVRVRLWVDHDDGWTMSWPDTAAFGSFEVLASSPATTVAAGEGFRTTRDYVVTAFELGELEIPSLEVGAQGPAGSAEVLSTDPFGIGVESVGADDSGDIRAIKGPMSIARSWTVPILVGLLLLLMTGLGAYAWRRWQNRPREEPAEPAVPPRPFHELAHEALDALEASDMLDRGDVKEYHIRVSEIIRGYVEGQLEVPALELTTSEVVDGLQRAALGEDLTRDFHRFLEQCDLVKFAKLIPSLEASRSVLGQGRELVDATSGEAGRDEDEAGEDDQTESAA